MSKNEGIAFFVAICIAAPQLIRRLWPAAAVVVAWLCVRIALHLPTDVFTGNFTARIAHNVAMFPRAFANIPTEAGEITYLPNNTIAVEGENAQKILKLIEALEGMDVKAGDDWAAV